MNQYGDLRVLSIVLNYIHQVPSRIGSGLQQTTDDVLGHKLDRLLGNSELVVDNLMQKSRKPCLFNNRFRTISVIKQELLQTNGSLFSNLDGDIPRFQLS